ncbi:efflux RND transporter periplasmic adaptor subunit [Plastorhodobacter daqingensis]|uniref:Efflux RND transporter periplasmic adaptor subunit n=1 Tax=Plastorhodobacter daqingensis TaxID=1387281 RepID=A0ABW2UMM4_9RHOB
MRARFADPTILTFAAILLLVVLWIGSGMIGREPVEEAEAPPPRVPTVAASWSTAEEVTRELVLYGDVEPVQVATLRSRTDGIVEEAVAQGTRVSAGDVVARLSTDDRDARLAGAEAQLAAAERDYNAAQQLFERGVGPEAEARARLAQLEAARAELRAIELDIENTRLQAPISGIVNQVLAEVGSFVSPGGEVLDIVQNDPLVAVVHVQQTAIERIRPGMAARVRFVGGGESEGVLRFVSPLADAATRTFRVEAEIPNQERDLPAGLSAEVIIPYQTVAAHRVSAALGRLDEQGRLGLHVLDDENRVTFAPVEVIRARADGVWVTGLPPRVRIVTISQGSLAVGQQVEVQETPPEYLVGDLPEAEPEAANQVQDGGAAAADAPASTTAESP